MTEHETKFQLFSEVNSILYGESYIYLLHSRNHRTSIDDSPERGLDAARLLNATQNDSTSSSNITESGAISPLKSKQKSKKKSKPSRIPRREVRWRLDSSMNRMNRSLGSIARRFEDYLDCFQSSSSDYPLRRIIGSNNADSRRISHQCPEYLREEINLTSDVSRSAIISYRYPDQGELCSVCGQLVQHSKTSFTAEAFNRDESMNLAPPPQGPGVVHHVGPSHHHHRLPPPHHHHVVHHHHSSTSLPPGGVGSVPIVHSP